MLIFRLTKCNKMNNHVHIAHHQGSFIVRKSNCVIVTVHDIGTSHQSLLSFCSLPCIKAVSQRSLIVHVCLPGQEPQAEELDGQYPSMQVKQQYLQSRRLCVWNMSIFTTRSSFVYIIFGYLCSLEISKAPWSIGVNNGW